MLFPTTTSLLNLSPQPPVPVIAGRASLCIFGPFVAPFAIRFVAFTFPKIVTLFSAREN
jgi:hypothetical protein